MDAGCQGACLRDEPTWNLRVGDLTLDQSGTHLEATHAVDRNGRRGDVNVKLSLTIALDATTSNIPISLDLFVQQQTCFRGKITRRSNNNTAASGIPPQSKRRGSELPCSPTTPP